VDVTRLGIVSVLLWAAASVAAPASETVGDAVRVAVVAESDESHFAWAAARELERTAASVNTLLVIEPAPLFDTPDGMPDLLIMPVRSLASRIPAFEVLELPFLFPSLDAVRFNLDGPLGEYLATEAMGHGWALLAYWDEGMHILSGLKRYDRVQNLMAREFLVTRPDPVVERQFGYWQADVRRIDPENREAVLRECLIASRGTTLQEVMREQLYRVHLAMSLTNHRYEGWAVIAPVERWMHLDPDLRTRVEGLFHDLSPWQRRDTDEREATVVAELQNLGMRIYELDAMERAAFRDALPDWSDLLAGELSDDEKRRLVQLALTGTAAFFAATSSPHPTASDTLPNSQNHQQE
jgi:TRAP-type C4-dicarboxylate transport system substrate-binding protein